MTRPLVVAHTTLVLTADLAIACVLIAGLARSWPAAAAAAATAVVLRTTAYSVRVRLSPARTHTARHPRQSRSAS